MIDKVVGRFAPSPTGFLHIGGARTALFAWLYAKSRGGECLLRFEDTDVERSQQEFTDSILESFNWFNVTFDKKPFHQSKNKERQLEKVSYLVKNNKAYRCICSTERLNKLRLEQQKNGLKPKYDGKCRKLNLGTDTDHVIRFKNPDSGKVSFTDIIRGEINFANEELDDLVLVRRSGFPTYNLSVVVDDMDMGITHVIRGDDHLNNTPRQINIFEALDAKIPKYGHVPMILAEDGKRMSKRHGAISVSEYKDLGILPEAFLNYLVRLGWSLGDQELFSMQELKEKFKHGKMNKAPATFSLDKLLWYNKEYLSNLDKRDLITKVSDYSEQFFQDSRSEEVLDLIKERCSLLSDFKEESIYFFEDSIKIDSKDSSQVFNVEAIELLKKLYDELDTIEDWTEEKIHFSIETVMSTNKVSMGKVGKPFRLTITGRMNSPPIDKTAAVIGKDKVMARLKQVIREFS